MLSQAICQSEAFIRMYKSMYSIPTPFISNAIDKSTIIVHIHNLNNVCSYHFDGFNHII